MRVIARQLTGGKKNWFKKNDIQTVNGLVVAKKR